MLVEERCYVLHATATTDDFLRAYRAQGQEIQTRILGGLVGYFVTETGELNAIVSMWRYESFEDRLARRAQLAADAGWQHYLGVVRPMIASMSNRLLTQVI